MTDVIIIGSGPAGVSASLYARRAGLSVEVLSKGTGTLEKAELIENYYGFPEPVSGAELASRGIAGARRLGVLFKEAEVVWIGMDDTLTHFVVETTTEKIETRSIILGYLRCLFLPEKARRRPRRRRIRPARSAGAAACCLFSHTLH